MSDVLQQVLTRLDKAEKEIAALKKEKSRQRHSWTKVGTITKITGWDKERLRRARNNNEIRFKKVGSEIFYDLNSLNQLLVKKETV